MLLCHSIIQIMKFCISEVNIRKLSVSLSNDASFNHAVRGAHVDVIASQVNGHRLLGMNHIEVVTILKDLPVNVRMVCARRLGDIVPYRLIDTSQDRAAFAARVRGC